MNPFDESILRFANKFSQASSYFDHAVATVQENNLLKAGAIIPVFWWFWFQAGDTREQRIRRERLFASLVASLVGLFLARALALSLPFRTRPLYIEALAFKPPHGTDVSFFVSWSSFPSDHAVLLCALAAGLWLVSRWVGVLSFAYVFLGVCVPRVYMGIHYPTDILVGAAIGVGLTVVCNGERLRARLARPALRVMEERPGLFYAAFFLLTYQISDLFNAVRAAAKALVSAF